MQCAHQSLNGTCVASCSSLSFCVGLFLGPALTHARQAGAAQSSSQSILNPPSSDISSCVSLRLASHHVLLQLIILCFFNLLPIFCFLLLHLRNMLPALQACRKRLDHSLSLPAEKLDLFHRGKTRCPLCTPNCPAPLVSQVCL